METITDSKSYFENFRKIDMTLQYLKTLGIEVFRHRIIGNVLCVECVNSVEFLNKFCFSSVVKTNKEGVNALFIRRERLADFINNN